MTKSELLDRLIAVAEELSPAQIVELADFAGYLRAKHPADRPERGTADAILQALKQGGLRFEPGELDSILDEIEQMRLLDLEEND